MDIHFGRLSEAKKRLNPDATVVRRRYFITRYNGRVLLNIRPIGPWTVQITFGGRRFA